MFGLPTQLEALDKKGTPIRTAHVGAGAMGINLIGQCVVAPGMNPLIVVDIKIENCIRAYQQSGIPERDIVICKTVEEAQKAINAGKKVCSTDYKIIFGVDNIDVVVEGTGNVEVGAQIIFDTIRHKKHIVTLSVEMDVVVGNILKLLADNAGVTYTGIYGDEPGVIKLLYDTVKSLGFDVVAAGRGDTGNSDLKWNPDTVKPLIEERSRKRGFDPTKLIVNPYMFASFNDGSKTAEELTMVANATGLVPDVRGTHRPLVDHAEFHAKVPKLFDLKERGGLLSQHGVVESTGMTGPNAQGTIYCFVVITQKLDSIISGLQYHGSGGSGPTWVWWEPIHWIATTAPISIAYAALFNQASIAPLPEVRVAETITRAKKDLKAGKVIDEIGGFCVAGLIEKARIAEEQRLLPLGLAKGCILKRDVKHGRVPDPGRCRVTEDRQPGFPAAALAG